MLSLRVVRGPLADHQDMAILREYNRLTSSGIPIANYLRWVRESPDGPVFHALLESGAGEIAGHMCLIPLRLVGQGQKWLAAKAEYFFVREQFRKERVEGAEGSLKPAAVLLLERLYRHCRAEGWGPFVISAPARIHPLHMLAGCRAVDFPLQECLFVFRPWAAARHTPNLSGKQRAALFAAGAAQSSLGTAMAAVRMNSNGVRKTPIHAKPSTGNANGSSLSLFRDAESMRWRFPAEDYVRFEDDGGGEVIAKDGSARSYLRVSQWHLESPRLARSLVLSLLREGKATRAIGVRWAVYGQGEVEERLVRELRMHGFLCVRRVRRLLFYGQDKGLFDSKVWSLSDALFNFDQ